MARNKPKISGVAEPSAASGNGFLEFERPLARIEQELAHIEAQQTESKRDLLGFDVGQALVRSAP